MSDLTVAKTILEQLGGNRFARLTGATNFVGDTNSLSFKLPGGGGFCKAGINHVLVILTPADTYTVMFSRIRKSKGSPTGTLVATHTNIYADALQDVFSKATGLVTTTGRPLPLKLEGPWRGAANRVED